MNFKDIKFNGSNIILAKINGSIVFERTEEIVVSSNVTYTNNIFTITANKSGIYLLMYADENGRLSEYEEICSISLVADTPLQYTYFNSLNIAPLEATKIALCNVKKEILDTVDLPDNLKVTGLGNKLYSVGLLSDIHIDGNGDGNNSDSGDSQSDFINALNYLNEKNVDFACICGDLTYYGYEEDYQAYNSIISQYSNGLPIKAIRGNHETYVDKDTYDSTNTRYATYVGDLYYKYITANNDVYLFCGMYKESKSSLFSTEEMAWLQEQVETYKNNRMFLFVHFYYGDTGDVNGVSMHDPITNQDFINLITNNHNIIYVSGHTHLAFDLQKYGADLNAKYRDEICTRIHVPSLAKPRLSDTGLADSDYVYSEGSEGYIMDVYENNIILKGINFESNKIKPIALYNIDTTLIEYEDEPQILEGSITVYPSSYNSTDYSYQSVNNSYPLNRPIGKGSNNTTYSQWNIKTGSRAQSWVYYNFDLSSIPENATITSVTCSAKAYISNTTSSRIATRQMQMFSGTTAKGSAATVSNSATVQNLTVGNWTREELQNARLRIYTARGTSGSTTSYYNRFYGATLTVNYTYTN